MATVSSDLSCPLVPESFWARLSRLLNSTYHDRAMYVFGFIVLTHWAEHLVQAFQVYALGWPLKDARGVLGMPFPWLVKSEALHYGYAFVMLVGLWVLRKGFVGRQYVWWMIAFWIQFWHHIEHGLLQYQVIVGENFLGAPAPISIIQMLGLIEGTAATGFNGLMSGPPQHPFTSLLLVVRRVEVHMIYNTIVFIPMAIAMYMHMFPTPEEEGHMTCKCSVYGKGWVARRGAEPVSAT